MAYAYDTYTALAAQTDFTITFPYIDEGHVTVYKNGTLQTAGSANDYTIVTSTIVRFNSGLSSGDVVEIIRSTSPATRLVDYTSASTLTEDDLDDDSLQAFYLAQEALDDGTEKHLAKTYDDYWDFESLPSKNVPTPSLAGEVANKSYVDAYAAGAGNVPSPDNPTDDGKFLQANAGAFSWVTFVISMISDAASFMKTFLGSADVGTARANLGLGSASVKDAGTTDGELPILNADGGLTLTDTDASAASGPDFNMFRDSPSPADNDLLARSVWSGRNDAAEAIEFAAIVATILDMTDATEDGQLDFRTMLAGTLAARMVLGAGLQIGGPTGGDKGAGTLNLAADLYKNGTLFEDIERSWGAAQQGDVTALTSGTNIAIELSDSNNFAVTLAHNATLDNPTTTPVVGQSGIITVTQDGTGGRTLAFGTQYKFAGGTAPTLSTGANAVDTLAYYVKSTTEILISAQLNWS